MEWNNLFLELECDCFERVANVIFALLQKRKRIDPTYRVPEQKLALWYNPANATRRSLENSLPSSGTHSTPSPPPPPKTQKIKNNFFLAAIPLAKGFWLDETKRLSYYLAKV